MLFCHRGSKASTPPSPSQKPHDYISSRFQGAPLSDAEAGEWRLPSILTAGSLDELSNSSPLLPEAPVMSAALEAQLATLSNRQTDGKGDGRDEQNLRYSNRRPQHLSSASMHSLVSSITSQEYARGHTRKKSSNILPSVVDGNLSLPITHKKHYHYSGLSLLSLSHHRSSSSTLRKLRSLDVQQFSSLLDFEERYNDPWVGSISLRRTAKPNLENERHRENSLFLSILEAKGLHNKRRYYCDICLDRTLYARTTSKQCLGNSIFWAEEFDLNNLPDVSILTVSLYREAEGGSKDGRSGLLARSNSKKASKKSQNRLIGFVTLPVAKVCTRNPAQTWLTLQPPANADSMYPTLPSPGEITSSGLGVSSSSSTTSSNFISSASANNVTGGTGVQLRVSVRYKSVDVLPISAYLPLHTLVRESGLEFIEWFEHLIPLKLKEEVASCFVNLHERGGTAAAFLTELVVREVSGLENESMTFRSNTMATKAVESYIKLVGKDYLHNLLYRYIQRVLFCPETWEVDPDKLLPSSLSSGTLLSPNGQGTSTPAARIIQDYCARKRMPASGCEPSTPGSGLSRLAVLNNGRVAQPGSLVFSQTQLLQHLDLVWDSVCASLPDFPKPLLEVFSSFRAALEPSKGAEFCDKLISACIFLRFVCPAILTPSLFGLASTFPGESNCQRNLTLVAKSLQSLANLSTFDDKESFMRFMNAYVEAQIPVMRSFLRDISSLPGVLEPGRRVASPIASNIDCGYELACLQNICLELFSTSSGQHNFSNPSAIVTAGSGNSPISSLPPSLTRLPEIVSRLENLKNGIAVGTDLIDTRAASDSAYASVDSNKRFPAPTTPYATPINTRNVLQNPLSRFYLPMEESISDLLPNTGLHQSPPETNAMNSSIRKPRAVRPTTVQIPTASSSIQQLSQHQSSFTDALMTSPKSVTSLEEEEGDRVTLKELLKASAFTRNSEASCSGTSAKVASHENDVDYDDPYIDEAYDSQTQTSRRRTIYDAPYEEGEKSGGGQTSGSGASPVQFPSPPSAFSLYRRPLATTFISGDIHFTDVPPMECSASLVTVPSTSTASSTSCSVFSSTIAATATAGLHISPRRPDHHNAAHVRDPSKASSTCAAKSPTSDILVLEPRPSLIITHLKPHLSRSSTTSSSSRSSFTSKQDSAAQQHHYPYRQAVNSGQANCTPGVTATAAAAATTMSVGQKMSSSVDSTLFQMDHNLGNASATMLLATPEGSGTVGTGSCWTPETMCTLPTRRMNGFAGGRSHPLPSQPVLAENEQLLTSTLEELGDAVAWLEKERIDLLNKQEHRHSNSHPRSRPGHSSSFGPLSPPKKDPTLTIHTSVASRISPTPSAATHQHLHPHTSTPSLRWLNYTLPTDEISPLAKSTNSLIEQTLLQHKNQRSAVSKIITLTRSGSSSASPLRRNWEGSDSSDNTSGFQPRRRRTTTLVLASKAAPTSGPQTPVEMQGVPSKGSNSEELEFIVLHPYRPRPHLTSFVSTSNCSLLRSNNPPPQSTTTAAATIAVAGGDVARLRKRGTGGLFVLSSSPLTS
ncbi:Disabled -like protein 2-interacting protein [Echinococcus granulosus]|uniref:Synaptic ras gtpase activating protein syngap n=1 Tax=Echinococcus granulosus TaxID=6210 RepID=A0A068W743_ECHGR|nr:Disabled -like protein 2-interacting protein [Echinococcus granulosus]CDS15350.1 synaptic ras gtpase activating protein syngap [Echinococcus granulosus]